MLSKKDRPCVRVCGGYPFFFRKAFMMAKTAP